MVTLAKLEDVRNQIKKVNLDKQAIAHSTSFTERMSYALKEHGVKGRVFNNGSTHESRMSYVLDPTSQHKPFPPDIDLNVIVNVDEVPKGLMRTLLRPFNKGGNTHEDGRNNKAIGVLRAGDFNVSMAVYTRGVATENGEFNYNDRFRPFNEEQRLEARTFKIVLQRHGCYAGYNNGITGIAVDEMIQRFGRVEGAFEFLDAGLRDRKELPLILPDTEIDLMKGVNKYTKARLREMIDTYKERGLVNATSFEGDTWQKYNKGKMAFSTSILCAPASCGREGSDVARATRENLREITEVVNVKRGIDYFIVPCQGKIEGGSPHTMIAASFDPKERKDINRDALFLLFEKSMKLYGATESHPPNIK